MKVSGFRLVKKIPISEYRSEIFASVLVETGFLFKKRVRKLIRKEYIGNWHFADSGKFTPGDKVECLVRAFEAKYGPLENIDFDGILINRNIK